MFSYNFCFSRPPPPPKKKKYIPTKGGAPCETFLHMLVFTSFKITHFTNHLRYQRIKSKGIPYFIFLGPWTLGTSENSKLSLDTWLGVPVL